MRSKRMKKNKQRSRHRHSDTDPADDSAELRHKRRNRKVRSEFDFSGSDDSSQALLGLFMKQNLHIF